MAPPYTDDPGCKYIVIEDPWPGDKSGKNRDQLFYNYILAWVRFILGRTCETECLHYMNTRDEVIVQLPQEVELVPILGAHAWRKFLSSGDPKDRDRISYVFEYDYRNRGQPGSHNWTEMWATVFGDPPVHVQFPVKIDYPRPDKATPRGRKCGDLALPLPSTWQPPPDTSAFTQYRRPSLLTDNTVNNANAIGNALDTARRGDAQLPRQERSSASGTLGEIGPCEEMNFQCMKREAEDVKPRIKQEDAAGTTRVKQEGVKHEDAPDLPSEALVAAFQQVYGQTSSTSAPPTAHQHVKPEEEEEGPSDALIAAFHRVYGEQSVTTAQSPIKAEPEIPHSPSARLVDASETSHGFNIASASHSVQPLAERITVKPEPHSDYVSPEAATAQDIKVKLEPGREPMRNSQALTDTRQVRDRPTLSKRVKHEERDEPSKRLKREYGH